MPVLSQLRDVLLRRLVYRRYEIGPGFHAGRGTHLWAPNKLVIGDNFYMGRYSQIECDAVIGDHVMFANFVSLVGKYDHNYEEVGVPIKEAINIRSPNISGRAVALKPGSAMTYGSDWGPLCCRA